MRCPMCKYHRMHITQDGQSSVDAAKNGVLRSSHFCTHPDVVREKGDGVNPVPLDTEIIRIANERYRYIPKASKWDRSPSTFYMTPNVHIESKTFRVIDEEEMKDPEVLGLDEDGEEIIERLIWMNAVPIQKAMEELQIVDFREATSEQREIILGIREKGYEDKPDYVQQKVNVHAWIAQQLWDCGCDKGRTRMDPNDPTDVGLKVKVRIL